MLVNAWTISLNGKKLHIEPTGRVLLYNGRGCIEIEIGDVTGDCYVFQGKLFAPKHSTRKEIENRLTENVPDYD